MWNSAGTGAANRPDTNGLAVQVPMGAVLMIDVRATAEGVTVSVATD